MTAPPINRAIKPIERKAFRTRVIISIYVRNASRKSQSSRELGPGLFLRGAPRVAPVLRGRARQCAIDPSTVSTAVSLHRSGRTAQPNTSARSR